jgi:Leucine-rich repeat (LRR) protein
MQNKYITTSEYAETIGKHQELDKKYVVYKNDLKYRSNRDLNIDKIIFDNDEVKDLYNKNLDSLEYRLKECDDEKYTTLDLKHMDLIKLPEIPISIKKKIKHLFMSDNELTELSSLSDFINLESVDISRNKLKCLPKLPISITELNCSFNLIDVLPDPTDVPNLAKLECNNNKLSKLPNYKNLIILSVSKNNLESIPSMLKLEKLSCFENKVNNISSCPKMQILDCSNNDLKNIPDMPLLIDLICNRNDIQTLPDLSELKYLECIGTNLKKLKYYKNLREMLLLKDQSDNLNISPEYKIKNVTVHKKKYIGIEFETNEK